MNSNKVIDSRKKQSYEEQYYVFDAEVRIFQTQSRTLISLTTKSTHLTKKNTNLTKQNTNLYEEKHKSLQPGMRTLLGPFLASETRNP